MIFYHRITWTQNYLFISCGFIVAVTLSQSCDSSHYGFPFRSRHTPYTLIVETGVCNVCTSWRLGHLIFLLTIRTCKITHTQINLKTCVVAIINIRSFCPSSIETSHVYFYLGSFAGGWREPKSRMDFAHILERHTQLKRYEIGLWRRWLWCMHCDALKSGRS